MITPSSVWMAMRGSAVMTQGSSLRNDTVDSLDTVLLGNYSMCPVANACMIYHLHQDPWVISTGLCDGNT
jgi:hypothetical protein